MSTTASSRIVKQRAVEATSRLRQALGVSDLQLLSAAVAEVSAEEISINPAFARRIRSVYQELVAAQSTRPIRSTAVKPRDVELIPLAGTEGARIDPYAPLDAYLLIGLYGPDQLRTALSAYTVSKLKQALTLVQEKNPGTAPASRAKKDSIIDYIVEHVAGPGY